MVFLLGSVMAWRDVAAVCIIVPLTTLIAICFVSCTFSLTSGLLSQAFTSILILIFSDTRNAIMADIEKSPGGSASITAMAARLGQCQGRR